MVATFEPTRGAGPEPCVDGKLSADELAVAIQHLHDELTGCLRRLLAVIAEFDRRQLWETDGALAMPPWLVELLGISAATAHTWTRVAAALEELPETAATFGDGDLSFDQVRALVRFVTPRTDARWAEEAPRHTVDGLHRMARALQPVTPEESQQTHADRSLTWY